MSIALRGSPKCLSSLCSAKVTQSQCSLIYSRQKRYSNRTDLFTKNFGHVQTSGYCRWHTSAASSKTIIGSGEKPFRLIGSEAQVDTNSQLFKDNAGRFAKHVEILNQAEAIAQAGGGEKSIERHVKRHGKLMISDRVKHLVDSVDDFLELSLTGGIGMEYGHVPRASSLTGKEFLN